VLALVPTTAPAKPAIWYPRENVDSEQLATTATAQLTSAMRARNTAGIAKVLGTAFTSNGMWFPDATCTKRFESGGEIKGAEVGVFARCLAQLKPQMSTRKSYLRDGAVLTVDPGIEIEVVFKGDTLRWIGFPLQSGSDRAIPMLTAQALESLRTAGTTVLDSQVSAELDLELTRQHLAVLTTWIETCLDPAGEIARTRTITGSSPATSEAFLRAISDWKFQPFKVRGEAMPACGVSLLTYPGTKAPSIETYPSSQAPLGTITRSYDFDDDDLEFVGGLIGGPPPPPPPPSPINVPPSLLENLRVSGSKRIVPDARVKADILAAGKTKVVASMKMCLDDKGNVSSVAQLKSSGYPAYDRTLMTEMRQWLYRPYKVNGKAAPVCTAVTFIYDASRP
jgi:hypothetical protein